MTLGKPPGRCKWKARDTRMLIYLLVLLSIAAWKFMPRPWHPAITFKGPHHTIYSSATPQRTEATARILELMYGAYSDRLLIYFVFESPTYRERALRLVERGGGLAAFEEILGPVEQVQPEWHAYVRRLKADLNGSRFELLERRPHPERMNSVPGC